MYNTGILSRNYFQYKQRHNKNDGSVYSARQSHRAVNCKKENIGYSVCRPPTVELWYRTTVEMIGKTLFSLRIKASNPSQGVQQNYVFFLNHKPLMLPEATWHNPNPQLTHTHNAQGFLKHRNWTEKQFPTQARTQKGGVTYTTWPSCAYFYTETFKWRTVNFLSNEEQRPTKKIFGFTHLKCYELQQAHFVAGTLIQEHSITWIGENFRHPTWLSVFKESAHASEMCTCIKRQLRKMKPGCEWLPWCCRQFKLIPNSKHRTHSQLCTTFLDEWLLWWTAGLLYDFI